MPKLIFLLIWVGNVHQNSYPRWPQIYGPNFGWFGAQNAPKEPHNWTIGLIGHVIYRWKAFLTPISMVVKRIIMHYGWLNMRLNYAVLGPKWPQNEHFSNIGNDIPLKSIFETEVNGGNKNVSLSHYELWVVNDSYKLWIIRPKMNNFGT